MFGSIHSALMLPRLFAYVHRRFFSLCKIEWRDVNIWPHYLINQTHFEIFVEQMLVVSEDSRTTKVIQFYTTIKTSLVNLGLIKSIVNIYKLSVILRS